MTASEFGKSFRETYATILSPLTLFLGLIITVVTIIAAPFGTATVMSVEGRVVYWVLVVTASIILGYAARATSMAVVGPRRPILFDAVAVLLMTAVMTPLVVVLRHLCSLPGVEPVNSPLSTLTHVFLVAVGVFVLRRLLPGLESGGYARPFGRSGPEPRAPEVQEARLLRRLPESLRGAVLRISANDHNVEVVTTAGRHKLRMRLTDAIDEMEPAEGYCTHRSHWVARAAIVRVERETAHRSVVVLENGDRVPVSRKYRPGLEEAGIMALEIRPSAAAE